MALPAVVGSVWMQAHRAAHADLPEFDDLDVTGYYGPEPTAGGARLRIAAVGDSTLTGPGLDHAREAFVARVAARRRPPDPSHPCHAVGDRGRRRPDATAPRRARRRARPRGALGRGQRRRPLDAHWPSSNGTCARWSARSTAPGSRPSCAASSTSRSSRGSRPRSDRCSVAAARRTNAARHEPPTQPRARCTSRSVDASTRSSARGEAFFTPDRFHPNGEGHRCLAEALSPHFEAAVARAQSVRRPASTSQSGSQLAAKYAASTA